MPTLRGILGSLIGIVFEYDTPKFVHIKNKKIGVLNRLIQIGIIIFMVGYGIVYEQGYLESAPLVSVITTKVKGAQLISNETNEWKQNCYNGSFADHLLDSADLVVPPQEPNSFFVTTNMWVTCNQTEGVCPEDSSVKDSKCTNNSDCPKDEYLYKGNGITTGICSGQNCSETHNCTCDVTAWCPVQKENKALTKKGPKIDTAKFTVLIKNSISCPDLDEDFSFRNFEDEESLENCSYFDNTTDKGQTCPKFNLSQIVEMVNANLSYNGDLATWGAVVGLRIKWDCIVTSNSCDFTYSARQLDKSVKKYDFRYPHYYYIDGVQYRDLVKAYGILFVIQVTGQCHAVSYINIFINLGSMIALLTIATVICDILVLYTPSCILPRSKVYRQKKYQNVDIQEVDVNGEDNYGTFNADSDSVNKPVD